MVQTSQRRPRAQLQDRLPRSGRLLAEVNALMDIASSDPVSELVQVSR
ncbi:MAG TPA: hypothetical protein VLJ88_00750 [Propionibacteriaceae bacterium]|nr:hypothetical protein [Propionibacteriaceae bacterium]